ncbi:MAG: site-2 protease family protein [Candidatus Diapherotrites archaeon]|nr:site-2 protease family protein [Candidatus Diapherotrites archaeon]
MDYVLLSYGLLIIVPLIAYWLIKKKFQILFLFRSKRLAKKVDDVAKKWGGFVDKMATFGFIIGTGIFGFWYLNRKYKTSRKYLLFAFGLLSIIFVAWLLSIPLTKIADITLLSILFSIIFGVGFVLVVALGAQGMVIIDSLFTGAKACPSVAPVLPGVALPNISLTIPLFEGWFALFLAIVVHELSHAILIRRYGLKLKSVGLVLLGGLPLGAFAEPDDKQFNKAKEWDRYRVLAAGPTANLLLAFICVVLGVIIVAAAAPYTIAVNQELVNGVVVVDVQQNFGMCGEGEETGAYAVGVQPGWLVKEVNGDAVTGFETMYPHLGTDFANQVITVTFEDTQGNTYGRAIKLGSNGLMGVTLQQTTSAPYPWEYETILFSLSVLNWCFLLNLMVGLFNFIPLGPMDGGLLQSELMAQSLHKKIKMDKKKLTKLINFSFLVFILAIIVINALPWFV